MKRKVYHVTKSPEGEWKGRLVGAARASVSADTKAEAVARTTGLARESKPAQVVIHKETGGIQSERTYGADPRRYPS